MSRRLDWSAEINRDRTDLLRQLRDNGDRLGHGARAGRVTLGRVR